MPQKIFSTTATPISLCWCKAIAVLALGMTNVMPTLAACPSSESGRFAPTGVNNSEVKDRETGLTWQRCSVGQSWDGTACTGTVITMGHEAALTHANGQDGWRLPNVRELSSLLDLDCRPQAIDPTMFPGTPGTVYWTTTPYAGSYPAYAWGLDFYFGAASASHFPRAQLGAVRLVRTGQ